MNDSRQIVAEETAVVEAPAATIYSILADYRHGHPLIIPKKYFSDLEVEEGGVGAGTVIRFRVRLMGVTRAVRARVEEPEPGRVLTETDLETGAVTTFVVSPSEDGKRAWVTIRTSWRSRGWRASLEAWLMPPVLKKIYLEELSQLEQVARARQAPASA